VHAWCSVGEFLPVALFSGVLKAATDATADRCLAFDPAAKDNGSLLTHEACQGQLKLPYICEPTCTTATCPSTCVKNVKYMLQNLNQIIILQKFNRPLSPMPKERF